jgi:hypothetical protein
LDSTVRHALGSPGRTGSRRSPSLSRRIREEPRQRPRGKLTRGRGKAAAAAAAAAATTMRWLIQGGKRMPMTVMQMGKQTLRQTTRKVVAVHTGWPATHWLLPQQ